MLTADCQNSVTLISNPSLLFHLPQTTPHGTQLVYFMANILKVVIEHSRQTVQSGNGAAAQTALIVGHTVCKHRKDYSHSKQGRL